MHIPTTVLNALQDLVGPGNVLTDAASLWLHAYDCSLSRSRPDVVVRVPQRNVVPALVTLLSKNRIPFVARGAATNHAGSCAALRGGAVLNFAPLNHILQIDTQHGFAWVEPGVITAQLQRELDKLGFFYAPDPASERVCTLGGNFAQNASGARCMKYGPTLDHVLAAEAVFPSGKTLFLTRENTGPDLLGLLCGSEGTLALVTRLKVKILPKPAQVQTSLITFSSLENCVQAVTDLTACGVVPRCVEAMDRLTIQTVENFAHAGYPADAAALLITELDGTQDEIARAQQTLQQVCHQNGATDFIHADTPEQRSRLWLGRKAAYAALSQLAPTVMVGDGTVPRSELPRALSRVRELLSNHNVFAGLLFHAGDGNFHPHLIFDERNRPETNRFHTLLNQILQVCVDCGGTVSGEHGIGVEKRAVLSYQYDKPTLDLFAKIKTATDPHQLANPLKIIPLGYAENARTARALPAQIQPLWQQLKAFEQNKTPFVIMGQNTRLKTTHANVLSARTLDQIYEIDLTNYTLTAGAGVPLKTLRQALAARGVFTCLPEGEGTLAGAFCAGQFPELYAAVTGIEALLPDGSYIRYGGKLTKNAAGYNLVRLFAGSQGNFGLVTQLTLKIFATPQPVLAPQPFQKAALNPWAQTLARALNEHRLLQTQERV